jgi:hypothetical protein
MPFSPLNALAAAVAFRQQECCRLCQSEHRAFHRPTALRLATPPARHRSHRFRRGAAGKVDWPPTKVSLRKEKSNDGELSYAEPKVLASTPERRSHVDTY